MRTRAAVALAVLGIIALAGCTPETEPAPTPTTDLIVGSEQTSTSSPSVTSDAADAEPTEAPSCDELAPLDWLHERIHPDIASSHGDYTFTADGLPGPVAKDAFQRSTVLRSCAWGIPETDGGFTVAVLTIDAHDEQTLTDALASSEVYTTRDDAGYTMYTRTIEDGIGASFAQGFAHGYWVVAQGTMLSEEHAATIVNLALEDVSATLF